MPGPQPGGPDVPSQFDVTVLDADGDASTRAGRRR